MQIRKHLSFEKRTIKFINDYTALLESYSSWLGSKVIKKLEFLQAVNRINACLTNFVACKIIYKRTKNSIYKKQLKSMIKVIHADKKLMKSIIGQNRNYYLYIFTNNLSR